MSKRPPATRVNKPKTPGIRTGLTSIKNMAKGKMPKRMAKGGVDLSDAAFPGESSHKDARKAFDKGPKAKELAKDSARHKLLYGDVDHSKGSMILGAMQKRSEDKLVKKADAYRGQREDLADSYNIRTNKERKEGKEIGSKFRKGGYNGRKG